MGYLTTITIRNDAMHEFEKDPKAFGEAILKGIELANRDMRECEVPCGYHGNPIIVQHSRHADDHAVYVHRGNTVFVVGGYEKEFKELVERLPEVAKDFLDTAQVIITQAKKLLKK